MAFSKDTEDEQLRQLVKACLLEISKLKIELKKCQKENSKSDVKILKIKEFREEAGSHLRKKEREIKEKEAKIKGKEQQLTALEDLINQRDEKIKELHKYKQYFQALTAKPKKDLTSFQSQIYQLLPDREDTQENLYAYITEIGFSELSGENFEHLLHNLERKGYFESFEHEDEVFWKKIDK